MSSVKIKVSGPFRAGTSALPKKIIFLTAWLTAAASHAQSADPVLDSVGVTLLRATNPGLDGTGVRVVQVEDINTSGSTDWEVDPAFTGQPPAKFAYYSSGGSSTSFPNSLGIASAHAYLAGDRCYGFGSMPAGVATNVAHIDNYEADYFLNTVVPTALAVNAPIVNQSFIATGTTVAQQQTVDTEYDKYAVQYGTLFVSAVGGLATVSPPGTCYNGIGVGAYGGSSSTGPTPDNGRAKPDITAPEGATSFSTPRVAGAAAIMLQAGLGGNGGSDTTSASDPRTIKALLLNGAVKPHDWHNPSPSPLDPRYGTGILNVFNSYEQLAGGKHGYIDTSSVSSGGAHPPTGATGNVSSLNGWDFNTIASPSLQDGINHYYFNLSGSAGKPFFNGVMTLVWQRNPTATQTGINNLYLYVYAVGSGQLVASSISKVDNVQHVSLRNLPPGRYDLQVLLAGGTLSNSETYALAFSFFGPTSMTSTLSGGNVALTWPYYPAGYALQSTPSVASPVTWTTVSTTPTPANGMNLVLLPPTGTMQYFRLSPP